MNELEHDLGAGSSATARARALSLAHPAGVSLEAFAAGETSDDVADHIASCVLCRDHVVKLCVAARLRGAGSRPRPRGRRDAR